MADPSICILVLNWNGVDDTLECVQSLKELTYSNAKIVVIDNGSTDDSVQRIKRQFTDVKIIELKSNLLFGGGNNVGLEWAHEHGFDYVIFLNNDTTVEPDFIEPLLKGFKHTKKVGMAGPLMCYSAKPELIWYGGGIVNLWTGLVEHEHIREYANEIELSLQKTDYITGGCLMMPTQLAVNLGGFDPSFKMYGEDVDLSLRTRDAGFDLIFVPASKIYHKVSASVGGEFSLKKMRRKLGGLYQLFRRYVSWYQWPVLLLGQLWFLLRKSTLLLRISSGSQSGESDKAQKN